VALPPDSRQLIGVINVGLAGGNSQAQAQAIDGTCRINVLSREKTGIQRATAIGVLNAVQVGVGRVLYSRRKMDAADKANGAAGEWRLIVALHGRHHRGRSGIRRDR
jgi:hypothetical protein